MGARGKQSAASMEVVQPSGITAVRRPDPPDELDSEQAHEWRCVVNRMPADWFPRETHAMLIQYCRHVVSARRVSELMENFITGETELKLIETYNKILIMQEREGRAMSALATRMRISQHAQYNYKKSIGTVIEERPWE